MVALAPASIVVIPFPFSDLSGTKLRPALVLAETGQNDWLLCQITSKPYDPYAITLTDKQLSQGSLQVISYVRPMKLFTANSGLMKGQIAVVNGETFSHVLTTTIDLLRQNLPIP